MSALTAEYLRSRLDYDPATGVFTWRPRDVEIPQHAGWNMKWAGRRAGVVRGGKYRSICLDNSRYYEHHLAWLYVTGQWPEGELDHRNRRGTENAFANLRPADRSQNCANTRVSSRNSSGAKGVSPCARDGRWQVQIKVRGVRHFLGRFDTVAEGKAAYDAAAKKFFGEYAAL